MACTPVNVYHTVDRVMCGITMVGPPVQTTLSHIGFDGPLRVGLRLLHLLHVKVVTCMHLHSLPEIACLPWKVMPVLHSGTGGNTLLQYGHQAT